MKRRKLLIVLGAPLLAATVLAGCTGSYDAPASPQPGVPVPTPSATETVVISPDEGRKVREWAPVTELNYSSSAASNKVTIMYMTGNPHCFASKGAVRETTDKVFLDFSTGWYTDVEACTMEGRFEEVEVTLKKPLGDREVVNVHGSASPSKKIDPLEQATGN